jgi:secreted Zn-dependent insulinase-like peptidase
MDILYIFWQIPNMDKYYKYKPLDYIFSLLGYSGKGSIFDVLKENDYCTKVKAGIYESDTSFHLVGMNIELTKKGFKHYGQIVSCVESYIKLIKHSIFNDFLLDEIKILNNISFNYSVIPDKITYVSDLSMNMIKYDVQDIIYGEYIINIEPQTKKIVNECLKYVDIDKSMIIISSKTFESPTNLKSKWYNAEFMHTELKRETFPEDLKNKLKLPTKNEFIPYDLKLSPILNTNLIKQNNIWYKSDTFNVPKVFIDVVLYSDDIISSPTNYLLFEIYLALFEYYNYDKLVYAAKCETGYNVINDNNCVTISFYGFNNNIQKIVELFMNTFFMFTDHITQDIFNFIKNDFITDLSNYIYDPLTILATERLTNAVYSKYYSNQELINVIDQIKFCDIYIPKKWLYKMCDPKIFIYGNIDEKIIKLTDNFNIFKNDDNKTIDLNKENSHIYMSNNIDEHDKIIELHNGETQIYIIKSQNQQDNNYFINIFFEVERIIKNVTENWEIKMLCTMFINMFVQEKFFTQLRTKDQTGYIVKSFIKKFMDESGYLYGISFLVQSPHVNPVILKKKIKKFIHKMHNSLLKLKKENLDLYKNNIKFSLEEKLVSQYEEHDFIFGEILSNEYAFDYKKILINNINLLNLDILIKFYETYFINKNTKKVRICEIYKKK